MTVLFTSLSITEMSLFGSSELSIASSCCVEYSHQAIAITIILTAINIIFFFMTAFIRSLIFYCIRAFDDILGGMLDYFTAIVITHLFGVIIGAGGAFAGDLMFFNTVQDRKISKTEIRFLKLGSKMVWAGLFIIVVSGFLIFLTDVDKYLLSDKFMAKMTIIAMLVLNGVIFHILHIPLLHRHSNNKSFSLSKEFGRRRTGLLLSGVVSMVSWLSAFILGSLKNVPYTYVQIMFVYLFLLLGGSFVALLIRNRLLPHKK